MTESITAVIDLDPFRYAAASVGEQRSVLITHKSTKESWHVATRTEFHGRSKKTDSGILAALNEGRESPYARDEFTYEDIQTPEPIENILHVAKLQVDGALQRLGTKKYIGVIGKGDSWRVERSTLSKYKDNRKDVMRPVHLSEVGDYLIRRYNAEVCKGLEADDKLVMYCYGKKDHVGVGVDKDFYGCPIRFYNYTKHDQGINQCNQFGKLYLNDKGEVKGIGRMFFYWQMLYGDDSDGYWAGKLSATKWGEKSAYKALVGCKNDKEALQALVDNYKLLYPEPMQITTWKGNEIEIDALYVMQEMFDMAHMLRFEGDNPDVKSILDKHKVNY